MTQEEKQLMIQDLCARLPYGVKVEDRNGTHALSIGNTEFTDLFGGKYNIKPYLRPMSSMTDEEKEELKEISNDYLDEWENAKTPIERLKLDAKVSYKRAVFYNSHHLDWNGLIEKNLALDCTGLHIYD